jgi:thioredoxin reductase/NAD-dependent dihydropyrimidine dehydrogenase PreA subunit
LPSTIAFFVLILVVVALYLSWERADRAKERVALGVVEDLESMGEVVATSLSPRIDPDICIGSGACVAACPEKGVIGLVRGQAALINPLGCIGHGACASACPVQAVRLVYGTTTRGVELPVVDQNFQTERRGVYIAGELGGMGLIRNAIIQGRQAAEHIAQGEPGQPPRRGLGDALDALVIGAGPAGISATLRLMQAGLRVLMVDREGLGGTILHYPRAKVIMTGDLELPLYGKVRGKQLSKHRLLALWQDIDARVRLPLVTGHLVVGLGQRADGMLRVEAEHAAWHAANVVLALGGRGSAKKLGVPGEESPKVSYRLLEPEELAHRRVLVIGGGNSAVESAVALAELGRCASVAISYRRREFARCRAENRRRIAAHIASGAVCALMGTEVVAIEPEAVVLRGEGGHAVHLPNDSVVIQIGGTPPGELLGTLGIGMVTKYGER